MALTVDSGVLIAIERREPIVAGHLEQAFVAGEDVVVPARMLAQVWRDGPRQARLARFLNSDHVTVQAMDEHIAKAAGTLCGQSGTADVVDAAVVWCARQHGGQVITSDPDDLRRLDPTLDIVAI